MECQNTGSLYASLSEEEKENKLIRIIIEEIQNDRQKNVARQFFLSVSSLSMSSSMGAVKGWCMAT